MVISLWKRDEVDKLVAKHKARIAYEDDGQDESDDEDGPRLGKPFVDWFSFNMGIGALIALNAFTMGLETDARGRDGDAISGIWYLVEVIFCLIFAMELGFRLYYHRIAFFTAYGDKWWNMADALIVAISIADAFVITPIGAQGGSMGLMKMLRFMRLMRLIRLVRLMHLFKELWLVASGLFQSAKTLCWVALIIMVFIYICAIFTTLTIGKNNEVYDPYFKESKGWDHEEFFATVPRSMFTLFQVLTFESWSERIVRHVMQKQPAMVVFFVFFIAVTSFGLLNIVVGVIVESTLRTSENDENKIRRSQERDRHRVFDHLRDIFEYADDDGSGTLTLAEVNRAIAKPEICNKLKMIEFPVEDPKQIFMLLDYDNSGELSIDEFIAGCIRMKGYAKSKDLLAAQVAVDTLKRHFTVFQDEMEQLQDKIELLDATARALVYQGEHVFLNLREYRVRHPELEFKASQPPQVNTHTIKTAPWNLAKTLPKNADNTRSTQDKLALVQEATNDTSPNLRALGNAQGAIWDQEHNRPGIQDNWALATMQPNNNSPANGPRCPNCGKAYDSKSQMFCTNCGERRPEALENGQLALGNNANSPNNMQLALASPGNPNQGVTDLALPGSI